MPLQPRFAEAAFERREVVNGMAYPLRTALRVGVHADRLPGQTALGEWLKMGHDRASAGS